MRKDDVLIVTGDHGNDPTTISTDHSREFTPLLVYGKNIKQNVNLETLDGFNQIGKFVEEYLIGEKNSAVGEMVWKK
jgi:phosphopentomutase